MSGVTEDQSPDGGQRPAKRRRGIACNECRDRKIRCDGARPICDSCARRNLDSNRCVYPDPERVPASSNEDYVRQLEQRLHQLEASIQNNGSPNARQNGVFLTPAPASRSKAGLVGDGSGGTPPTQRQSIHSTSRRLVGNGAHDDDDEPEANGTGQDLPLGESSISGFIKQAHDTLQRRELSRHSSPRDSNHAGHAPSPQLKTSTFNYMLLQDRNQSHQRLSASAAGIMLPSRQVADKLLQAFWSYEYPLMPLLHRPSFIQKYNALWEGMKQAPFDKSSDSIYERSTFYCLLCGVLALSYRNTGKGATGDKESEAISAELFERSRQLLFSGLLESGTVEVVQAIIYLAMYLRRVRNHHEAWIFIGLASRLAQALGIHYSLEDGSQADREIKRRTWYGCVILDSTQTTIFGQAPIAAAATLPLPSMIDDYYMETDPDKPDRSQPPDAIPDIAFYIFTTKLSNLTVNILRSIYNTRYRSLQDIPPLEFHMAIIRHDAELQAWRNELPRHLRHEYKAEYPGEHRLRMIIFTRIRYLDCRFLLFRATMLRLAGQTDGDISQLQEGMARGSLESCVSAIRELMGFFAQYRDTLFVPGPKHNVVCLLTAASVLFLIVRSPFFSQLSSPSEAQAHADLFADCMDLLRNYDRAHFPMRRKGAADAIDRLLNGDLVTETRDRVAQFAAQQSEAAAAAARGSTAATGATIDPGATASLYTRPTGVEPALSQAPMHPPPTAPELDPFAGASYFGDLTGDLQNPATWFPNDLDPFGSGFAGDFSMQDMVTSSSLGNGLADGSANPNANANFYAPQYGMWWQPPVG